MTEHKHTHTHEEHHHEHCCCCCEHTHEHHHEHNHGHDECGCGHDHGKEPEQGELAVLLIGALLFAAGIVLGIFPAPRWAELIALLAAYLLLGGEVLLHAAKNILRGQVFDENFLMSIATLGAFAIGEYPEAVGVMLFYRIGEYFEDRAVSRSRNQIMQAVDMRPEVVNRIENGGIRVIPAAEAAPGDRLLVRPGDRIPLDGVIIEGESSLDTSPLTGEPKPQSVKPGAEVFSGCVNLNGQLTLRVQKPLAESMVTRILQSVESAAAAKPRLDRFITRFARIYTPIVVLLAVLVAVLPPLLLAQGWAYWLKTALTFLVISCPCALVLSVPLAFFSGIGAASKSGVLFKGGLTIEALNRVKTVIMDKTGTLTLGNFAVQKVLPEGELTSGELLAMAAACEAASTHPVAQSIVAEAKAAGISFERAENLQEIAGMGIAAETARGRLLCGNQKLLARFGTDMSGYQPEPGEILLAKDGVYCGKLIIADTIKADARGAVQQLKKLGLTTCMLTGDAEDTAQRVAAETGIDEVYARLLPQDKLAALERIRGQRGAVMFVGDGINDAPVLAGADVGAAMGSGADAAIEAADIVFMNSNMAAVPSAIRLARAVNRIAIQNVIFALGIKAAIMLLGLAGHANMWLAVFADTGVAMLCLLNSVRILYRR